VDTALSAGTWLEKDDRNRAQAADLAARHEYFNQDASLLRYIMSNPRDRVTYGNLSLIRSELDELMMLGLEAHLIDHPIPYEKYADESFVRRYQPTEIRIGK
jgi:NitT/TauT family transport system substrate-binding protein